MTEMTVKITEDLKEEIDKHKEIDWGAVARQGMWKFVRKLEVVEEIAGKSKLTKKDADDLSKKLKHDIARYYR